MRITKGEIRGIHVEVGEQSSTRTHRAGERPLPVCGKRLAVQCPKQVEVHRVRLQLHVVHRQHRPTRLERHRTTQPGLGGTYVHVVNHVIQFLQITCIHDVEVQRPAPRDRERGVHPRDIRKGDGIAGKVNGIAHGQVAAPHHLAVRAPCGVGQVPVRSREPRAVAEYARHATDIPPLEWRCGFVCVDRVHHERQPRRIGIGNADVRNRGVHVVPPIRLRDTLPRAPDFVVLAGHVRADGAVSPRTVQGIIHMPGNGEAKAATIPDMHRIEDHKIAEPALRTTRRPLARIDPEEATVVPLPVLVLAQHHSGMLEVHAAEVESPVNQVARIVVQRHPPRRNHQRVLVVAQLQRIDRYPREEAAADASHVHLAVDRRLHARLDRITHGGLPILRLRREQRHANNDCPERNEHAQADQRNEVAASHGAARRVRNPARSKR